MVTNSSFFDVCIVCALAEEARAFLQVLMQQEGAVLQKGVGKFNREYRYTTIHNNKGEALSIYVSWLPRYGLLETGLQLSSVLREFNPRFVAMTGICAGDKRKVKLGDLVIADCAFIDDGGKVVIDKNGQPERQYDTYTSHSARDVLQFVRMFDEWEEIAAKLPRPISRRQQQEWLLNKLLETETARVDDIELMELELYVPDWRRIVRDLQEGSKPFLSQNRTLQDKHNVIELRYGIDTFPFKDPQHPTCYIAPMGSGNAVRGDNPFDEVRLPVRGTIAIDMEGAAFYQTVEDFPGIRSLVVKGVADYANSDKDDTYHEYASLVSALYVLCFIKDYVTLDLMPRASGQADDEENKPQMQDTSHTSEPEMPVRGSPSTYSIGNISAGTLNLNQGEHITVNSRYDVQPIQTINKIAPPISATMKLDKIQRGQFHEALLSAFPTRVDLKRMVGFGLDENLDNIASSSILNDTIFELIKWAQAQNRVEELIRAARVANKGNPQLRLFASLLGID